MAEDMLLLQPVLRSNARKLSLNKADNAHQWSIMEWERVLVPLVLINGFDEG